jgi:uncharacterized membrane protein YidH (DUF202 family)
LKKRKPPVDLALSKKYVYPIKKIRLNAAECAMGGNQVKIPIGQALLMWNRLMPISVLLGAFGLPLVGLQIWHLKSGGTVDVQRGLIAGTAVLCLIGLARILQYLDRYYYGGEVFRFTLSRPGKDVPISESILMAVFLTIAGLWCSRLNGAAFLAQWGLLAALFAVKVFMFQNLRFPGALCAGCCVAAECLVALPFPPRHWGVFPLAAAAGFGLVAFLVEWVLLFKPRKTGPLRDIRRREGWFPFAAYLLCSLAILALLVVVWRWPLGTGMSVGAILLGARGAWRISQSLTFKGVRQPERIGIVNYHGIPLACLAAALLLGQPQTAVAGAGLALASLAGALLSRHLHPGASFDPTKTAVMMPAHDPGK